MFRSGRPMGVGAMRIEFYGLTFEAPGVTFYLWSPWRASDLEHRIFKTLTSLPTVELEKEADEYRLHLSDAKTWRAALTAVARVMKGWQEEASDAGTDKRSWRWLLEADTDADGYDHTGERASLWGFLRVSLDRGTPGESEKGEDIDLDGFGLRVWGEEAGRRPR
jgi:hypothetical protein